MEIPQDYVSVDLETTGLNPKIDKIIEIGMVIVRNGQVTQEYSVLVNPYQQLRPETVELTGIHDEMLTDAPGIGQENAWSCAGICRCWAIRSYLTIVF